MITGSKLEICENGQVIMLTPLPEGVSNEEVEEAVKTGEITLRDGMITGDAFNWEVCNGKLLGKSESLGDYEMINDEGLLTFMTFRYIKE